MSHLRNALLAGAAVVTLAGAAGLAQAQSPDTRTLGGEVHVMTVQLPNGMQQQIRYTGDVPPRVVVVPVAQPVEAPFAVLERMSAEMDQQMARMMHVFSPMMAQPFGAAPITAAFGDMPPGAGVCMRSVSVTYMGNGAKPHVVSRTAGDCGPPAPAVNAPVVSPEQASPKMRTIQVKEEHPAGQPAYRALVVPVADLRG